LRQIKQSSKKKTKLLLICSKLKK